MLCSFSSRIRFPPSASMPISAREAILLEEAPETANGHILADRGASRNSTHGGMRLPIIMQTRAISSGKMIQQPCSPKIDLRLRNAVAMLLYIYA